MQKEPLSTEERLALLEQEVADLRHTRQHYRGVQDEINAALLDRVDGAYATIQRVERNLIRIHGELQTNHKALSDQVKGVLTEVQNHGADLALVQKNIGVLAETARDHKVGIEQIAADQHTMAQDLHELVILLKPGGSQEKPKTND